MLKPPTYPARPVNGGPLPKSKPKSGAWSYEPKYNGWNALVHIASGAMFNRHLEPLTIAKEFQPALEKLRVTLDAGSFKWANCEALERRHNIGRGTLIVFDVVPEMKPIENWIAATYAERHRWIQAVLPVAPFSPAEFENDALYCSPIVGVPAIAWEQLQAFNKQAGCEFYEGLVAKQDDSLYPIQLRSADVEYPFHQKHRWRF